jgi:hypothetical protein
MQLRVLKTIRQISQCCPRFKALAGKHGSVAIAGRHPLQFLGDHTRRPLSLKCWTAASLSVVLCLGGLGLVGKDAPLEAALPHLPTVHDIRVKTETAAHEMRHQVVMEMSQVPLDVAWWQKQDVTITFRGRIAPEARRRIQQELRRLSPSGFLTNIEAAAQPAGRLRVKLFPRGPVQAKVYTLARPYRLVVQLRRRLPANAGHRATGATARHTALKKQPARARHTTGIQTASAFVHQRWQQKTAHGPVVINVLRINPRDPHWEVFPVSAGPQLASKAPLGTLLARYEGIAAVNGSFFKPDSGIPLGTLMIHQELLTGPMFERVCLGIGPDNTIHIDRLKLLGALQTPDGSEVRLPLDNVNQPRTRLQETVLYSPRWGHTAPRLGTGAVQLQITEGKPSAMSTRSPLRIPPNGWVVMGPASGALGALVQRLEQGWQPSQALTLSLSTLPDWSQMRHIVSGGPTLVRGGQVYVDAQAQRFRFQQTGELRAPRTAAGMTHTGQLLLVTVDGRRKGVSVGMTLTELAQLMKKMGAVEAMNLDGGSSTQMHVAGRVVNYPSAGNTVPISTAFIVRRRPEV